MRLTLKNLIGSPYDIQTANGPAILPANGELTAEFTDQDAEIYRSSPGLTVSEAEKRGPGRPPKDKNSE